MKFVKATYQSQKKRFSRNPPFSGAMAVVCVFFFWSGPFLATYFFFSEFGFDIGQMDDFSS